MTCKYCYESSPSKREDEFCSDICKDKWEEIRNQARQEIAKRGINPENCWSEVTEEDQG